MAASWAGEVRGAEKTACLRFIVEQIGFLDEQIAEAKDGRESVIKIVRDPGSHLAEGAQSFLLNHLLLGRFEFVQRLGGFGAGVARNFLFSDAAG